MITPVGGGKEKRRRGERIEERKDEWEEGNGEWKQRGKKVRKFIDE